MKKKIIILMSIILLIVVTVLIRKLWFSEIPENMSSNKKNRDQTSRHAGPYNVTKSS